MRIICARQKQVESDLGYAQNRDQFFQTPNIISSSGDRTFSDQSSLTDRLVKAKSEQSLAMNVNIGPSLNKMKSRSLEPLTGLAMWSSEPVIIELQKGDRGLGFSILDYQVIYFCHEFFSSKYKSVMT